MTLFEQEDGDFYQAKKVSNYDILWLMVMQMILLMSLSRQFSENTKKN